MSSTTFRVALTSTVMSEWKEVMTQPSCAAAGRLPTTFANAPRRQAAATLAARTFIGSPYIAKSNDQHPPRHSKRGDHRPRRSRQDHAGRRSPEAEPHLPGQPAGGHFDHGLERPRARE